MKTILALSALSFALASFSALAGEPGFVPGPRIEPGPTLELDNDALNVLLFSADAGKLADLKDGANSIKATVKHIKPEAAVYDFTSQSCHSGIIFRCQDVAHLRVTGAWLNAGELSRMVYTAGEVVRAAK